MPHITVPEGLPGIVGPLAQYPETGGPLSAFTEALLRGPSSLTPAERELIAAHVSSRNECSFCMNSHAAAARHLWGDQAELVDSVLEGPEEAPVSEKMRALLAIATEVQKDGRRVNEEHVARARAAGADDRAIHDTVLVAAAFCMFNRYVDGLATVEPQDPGAYASMGVRLAEEGYVRES
jgi:uncharacterized peroxidase-related enzyme